jgi:hypothetical protein
MLDAGAEDADIDDHYLGAAEPSGNRQRQMNALDTTTPGHGVMEMINKKTAPCARPSVKKTWFGS